MLKMNYYMTNFVIDNTIMFKIEDYKLSVRAVKFSNKLINII